MLQQIRHRQEARIRHMEQTVQNLVDTVGHDVCANQQDKRPTPTIEERQSSNADHASGFWDPALRRQRTNTLQRLTAIDQSLNSGFHFTTSTYRRTWSLHWKIGFIRIVVAYTNRRINCFSSADSSVTIEVYFQPSQSIIALPGVSIYHSTSPTQQGYQHLAPMIAIHPIISDDHPVWRRLMRGDLLSLQQMLASGEVKLQSRDIRGMTFLHVSIPSPFMYSNIMQVPCSNWQQTSFCLISAT